jgi:hypothetical protein
MRGVRLASVESVPNQRLLFRLEGESPKDVAASLNVTPRLSSRRPCLL